MNGPILQATQTFLPHLGVASPLSSSPLNAAFPFCLSFPSGPLQGKLSHPTLPLEKSAWASASLGWPLGNALMCCYFSFNG